jgi:hypothetical protein
LGFDYGDTLKTTLVLFIFLFIVFVFQTLSTTTLNMLVKGRAFDGSTRMLDTYHHLLLNGGIVRWFSEFQPLRTDYIDILYRLLLVLNDVCCFLSGTYVCYLAGVLNNYVSAALFVVLTDCLAVTLLFQIETPPPTSFYISDFLFTLVGNEEELESFVYIISHINSNFSLYIYIHGIDTTAITGPSSNLNFVYFIWRYLERFSFKKHALIIHPSDDLFPSRARLLTLRHYRAVSDGWNDSADCDRCVELYHESLVPFTTCQRPAACACPICLRQPPSLRDLSTCC